MIAFPSEIDAIKLKTTNLTTPKLNRRPFTGPLRRPFVDLASVRVRVNDPVVIYIIYWVFSPPWTAVAPGLAWPSTTGGSVWEEGCR